MRAQFFDVEESTKKTRDNLTANVRGYDHHDHDIRDTSAVTELFKRYSGKIDAIVQTASQPSHDWAARDPQTDFTVNANGTLNGSKRRENCRPEAPFVFTTTNKVTVMRRTTCHCENCQLDGKSNQGMSISRESRKG